MDGLGERGVGEGLLHLDGLAGLDELVDVGGHGVLAGSDDEGKDVLALGGSEC